MLFHRLQASGILSFGPKGIDLPLRKLNVLIGPNGSGKSNVLELFSLFRAAPAPRYSIEGPMLAGGGAPEWMWKGERDPRAEPEPARIACEVEFSARGMLRHELEMRATAETFRIIDEQVEIIMERGAPFPVYTLMVPERPMMALLGASRLDSGEEFPRYLTHDQIDMRRSILCQLRDPSTFPALHALEQGYQTIQIHRDWTFGPDSAARHPSKVDDRSDSVTSSGRNLAVFAAKLKGAEKKRLVSVLGNLYPGIIDVHVRPASGALQLFVEEEGNVEIPATRLSDGTLRFLTLLLILLDPTPPPLIAIEEPELALHPDLIPEISKLLIEASERTQLVVTTHSRMLVDCLGEDPESIVVCEKHDGETVLERLEAGRMKIWLEKFSLGELWSKGELGGNRW